MAAEGRGVEPGGGAPRLDDAGDRAGIDRLLADDVGRRPVRGRLLGPGVVQIRQNTGPAMIPAAARQRSSARTGQSALEP
jgi:hypothetical protein